MEITAREIAVVLEGQVIGNEESKVSKLSKIEEGEEGSISFLANPKYLEHIYSTNASVVIVGKDFAVEKEVKPTLIKVEDAYRSFAKLLKYYEQLKNKKIGIENNVQIDSSAKIGENVYIGSFAYIGENVVVGDDVKIYPQVYIGDNSKVESGTILYSGVKLYNDTQIGKNCIVHSNTVIGSDGFGFAPTENGSLEKVYQIGNVIIEDDVEIGASCTIDRATMGSTIIRKGVKLDNQIQIAHNVEVDSNTVIASQSGIAGSTKVGKNCMIGGQVGIVGHLKVGDFVQIQAQSGVNKNVNSNEQLYGSPAFGAVDYRKSYVYFKKFPEVIKRLEDLEKKK